MKNYCKIIPIGGVGEIGSNMTLVQSSESCFLIDSGILFPYDDFFDIDYLIPNLNFLNKYPITDIIFTHGHEDHIGAVAHVLNKFPDIKVHCSQFCSTLIRRRLEELKIVKRLNIISPKIEIKIKDIIIHPIHVTHSIPETMGLIITNKDKDFSILFISDFKYDESPLYEKPFDINKISSLFNNAGIKVALLDSTNILNTGKTLSESMLPPGIEECFKESKGRMFVTLFSSNIHRMRTFIELARKYQRPFATLGRSVGFYLRSAREVGVIQYDEKELKEAEAIIDNENALIFVSGCQADHFSSMKKLAYGEHSMTKLKESDTIIFSSKIIPGNEDKVNRLYNKISETGSRIITDKDKLIHASGHPSQEDLKSLLEKINPDHYIPIHGETFFLRRHCQFIQENFKKIKPHFLLNQQQISINSDGLKITSFEQLPPVLIHGKKIEIQRDRISQRRKMACNGAVFATVNKEKRKIKITLSGLPQIVDAEIKHLETLLDKSSQSKKTNEEMAEKMRIEIRRYLNLILGYKPSCFIHII